MKKTSNSVKGLMKKFDFEFVYASFILHLFNGLNKLGKKYGYKTKIEISKDNESSIERHYVFVKFLPCEKDPIGLEFQHLMKHPPKAETTSIPNYYSKMKERLISGIEYKLKAHLEHNEEFYKQNPISGFNSVGRAPRKRGVEWFKSLNPLLKWVYGKR